MEPGPWMGKRRELTPQSFPLNSTHVMVCTYTYIPHKINEEIKVLKICAWRYSPVVSASWKVADYKLKAYLGNLMRLDSIYNIKKKEFGI